MKKKTNTTKKTNRWRPPKAFISKKIHVKREKPGRPKKIEKIQLPEIPEKKENKTKDLIILVLFCISAVVFGFSIYVSQRKTEANITKKQTIITNTILSWEILSWEILSWDIQKEQDQEPIKPNQEDVNSLILKNIYTSIEQQLFDEVYPYIDNSLKQTSTFKTYFSKNRLQRFITNIDNKNIDIEIIKSTQEENKVMYKLTYSIKSVIFREEREALFTTKNNEKKITKIMCTTKGCSTMPFFNPGKYF